MKTNIEVDNKLLSEAFKISGLSTKEEVIEEALRFFIQIKNQSRFNKFRGRLKWEGNLEEMRKSRYNA